MKDFLTNLDIKYKIAIVVGILIIIIVAFTFIYQYYNDEDEVNSNEDDNINIENTDTNKTSANGKIGFLSEEKKIMAHVIGEVNTPGVVKLTEGARIVDAINSAGGTTENADISKINLAYIIEDGVQIYVPRIGESDNTTYIKDDAGESIIIDNATQDADEQKDIKVNINSSNSEKLQTIPGVGAATAQKIIEYREQNGKFKNIEDIKNVSGIGDAKYEKLKKYIIVK